ncbi:hypothetical protein ACWDUN_27900 [Mycobacterium sp. NPDC003323]
MRLVAQDGLWATGSPVADPPAAAVLEVAGAVLAWPVDDPAAPVQLTFTDLAVADWVWRVTGEAGHVALVEALRERPAEPGATVDLPGVTVDTAALAPLRRLALGHWLRRWWPASVRDAIAELDAAVLDAEIALQTAAAQDFFAEDTLDSDIDGLLRPHRDTLAQHLGTGDPRVTELVRSCAELADWLELPELAESAPADRRRDDYALAAGPVDVSAAGVIAGGAASVSWSAVPPAVFDAAEDTVDWSVRADAAGSVVVVVRAAVTASAAGIAVRLRSGDIAADGVLAENGTATLSLPISESTAWNHDWRTASVAVGAGSGEDRAARELIRSFARRRLQGADDAFLAEVLAAESDY